MRRTTDFSAGRKITTDVAGLMDMLCCGQKTARDIAEAAGAGLNIGRRRLYLVSKVEQYLETLAGKGEESDG